MYSFFCLRDRLYTKLDARLEISLSKNSDSFYFAYALASAFLLNISACRSSSSIWALS